jgi:hypothetical protein
MTSMRTTAFAAVAAGALSCLACSGGSASLQPAGAGATAGSGSDAGGQQFGSNGSGGTADSGTSDSCPPYQKSCAGTCIPVSTDPNNCGGCGVTCSASQVCSASACSDGCLPGLEACNRACVDTQDDSNNCGGCGTTCPTNTGCVAGQCVASVGSVSGPACVGGGPPINLGGTTAGCVAQTTFTWALCSCQDVESSGVLLADAFDSTQGPYAPGGLGGGVGMDHDLASSGGVNVSGALWTSSPDGFALSGQVVVKEETHSGGPVTISGNMALAQGTYVNGDIGGNGAINVATTLYVPSSASVASDVTYASLVRGPVSVPPPCDCAAQDLLPINSWIAAARPPNNDNATINLDPNVLAASGAQPTRIDLPCGRFYLTSIHSSTPVTIAAHGNTALFIDGDVSSGSTLAFVLDPTAQFDVVIAGEMAAGTSVVIGSPNYPALSRTYFATTTGVGLGSSWQVGGNVYAAYGPVAFGAGFSMYGGLFAGDFVASGNSTIHYDRAVVSGGLCTPPPSTTTCGSCTDCGNQACVNGTCGACTTSADCCAPLVCESGSCQVLLQ